MKSHRQYLGINPTDSTSVMYFTLPGVVFDNTLGSSDLSELDEKYTLYTHRVTGMDLVCL